MEYVSMDGRNEIAISADVHDMESAQAMLAAPSADVVERWRATAS
jgi:hypothetical protein